MLTSTTHSEIILYIRTLSTDQRTEIVLRRPALSVMFYVRGLQTTARGPNPALEAISSGPQRRFATVIMKRQYNYEKFVDLVKRNISRNNHFM